MRRSKKEVQAITLRVPVAEYNLLRTHAFVSDLSINEIVLLALQVAIGPEQRRHLVRVLEEAREARRSRGRSTDLPRNPRRRGPKKRTGALPTD